MKRTILRPMAVAIATLSTVATMAVGAVSSQAAAPGTLTFTPATGTDASAPSVTTSAKCPVSTTDTNILVTMDGAGVVGQNVVANAKTSIFAVDSNLGGYVLPFSTSFADFASQQVPVASLAGTYTFNAICTDSTGSDNNGSFSGSLVFSGAAGALTYAANNPPAPVNYTTVTSLASTPSSPVNVGDSVNFITHVDATPTGGGAVVPGVGTIQLKDGTTSIGSPTALDASGNVTIAASFSTTGTHNVTAVFKGGNVHFATSTSTPADVYQVNPTPADGTSTSLLISPTTATSADTVTLSAHVVDTKTATKIPAGTVQFSDGGVNIGSAVNVDASGNAVLAQSYTEGTHGFAASFVPTSTALFQASSAASQPFVVAHFSGVQASEKITTTVLAGALTLSVADTSAVVLPSPLLNATATYLTTTGALHPVTVTDTRSGNPGWVVNGQVSDFVNTTGGTTTPINGFNLGWVPSVVDSNPGQVVQPGGKIDPATGPVTADLPSTDGHGLKVSRQLAKTDPGFGTGTADLGAALTLNVPTTTVAGTYVATLTLTAI